MIKNYLSRVLNYAARCCRQSERGCVSIKEIEKEFPQIADWLFDYFQWDEGKEFFISDGKTVTLKEYYLNIPLCVVATEITERCRTER